MIEGMAVLVSTLILSALIIAGIGGRYLASLPEISVKKCPVCGGQGLYDAECSEGILVWCENCRGTGKVNV